LYFNPCNSILRLKPSAIESASILVAPFDQFKKQVCSGLGTPLFFALWQTAQYRLRIPINKIFFDLYPIIVAYKNYKLNQVIVLY